MQQNPFKRRPNADHSRFKKEDSCSFYGEPRADADNPFKRNKTTIENDEWITPHRKNTFKTRDNDDTTPSKPHSKPNVEFSLQEELFPTLKETTTALSSQPTAFSYSNVLKQVQEEPVDETPKLKPGFLYIYNDGRREFGGHTANYYKTMNLVDVMKLNKFAYTMERNYEDYIEYCEWRDDISRDEEFVYNWKIDDYLKNKEFEKYMASLEAQEEYEEEHEQETEASDLEY